LKGIWQCAEVAELIVPPVIVESQIERRDPERHLIALRVNLLMISRTIFVVFRSFIQSKLSFFVSLSARAMALPFKFLSYPGFREVH